MAKPQADAVNNSAGAEPARRVLQCDGVPGVLEQRGGRWTILNETEVKMRAAVGDRAQALDRMRALVATLNTGLVDSGPGLTELNKQLRAIAAARILAPWEDIGVGLEDLALRGVRVPPRLLPAVAFACTHLPGANGTWWLAWMLSARLDSKGFWQHYPDSGGDAMSDPLCVGTRERDIRWMDGMPREFWDRVRAPQCCKAPRKYRKKKYFDELYHYLCPSDDAVLCLRSVAEASDPSTLPPVLDDLADSSQVVVQRLVASNSASPEDAFDRLYHKWNEGRLEYPAYLPLGMLVDLATDSSEYHQLRAAASDILPASMLYVLSASATASVRATVALNVNAPAVALSRLADDSEISVRSGVARNESCPLWLLTALLRDPRREVRAAAASNPRIPWRLASALVADRAGRVRIAVARRRDASARALLELAGDTNPQVRRSAAGNERTPPVVLKQLATSPDSRVVHAVAANPSTPPQVLDSLAAHGDRVAQSLVASNPSSPPSPLKCLAADPDSRVAAAVAGNPATPERVLRELASHDSEQVRAAVALNPSTPHAILEPLVAGLSTSCCRVLAARRDPCVRARLVEQLAASGDFFVRQAVASNPRASPKVLESLAAGADDHLRQAIAANPSAAAALLETLADAASLGVRIALAANPATPKEVLSGLAADADERVRYALAKNVACDEQTLDGLASDSQQWIRQAVALNVSTPASVFDRLYDDDDIDAFLVWSATPQMQTINVDLCNPLW